jgi:hypothetical protein
MQFNTPQEKSAYALGKAENSEINQHNFQLGFEEGRRYGYQEGLEASKDNLEISDALNILKHDNSYKILKTDTLEEEYKYRLLLDAFEKYSLIQLEEIFSVK